jgi:hypothetical protein
MRIKLDTKRFFSWFYKYGKGHILHIKDKSSDEQRIYSLKIDYLKIIFEI